MLTGPRHFRSVTQLDRL